MPCSGGCSKIKVGYLLLIRNDNLSKLGNLNALHFNHLMHYNTLHGKLSCNFAKIISV